MEKESIFETCILKLSIFRINGKLTNDIQIDFIECRIYNFQHFFPSQNRQNQVKIHQKLFSQLYIIFLQFFYGIWNVNPLYNDDRVEN